MPDERPPTLDYMADDALRGRRAGCVGTALQLMVGGCFLLMGGLWVFGGVMLIRQGGKVLQAVFLLAAGAWFAWLGLAKTWYTLARGTVERGFGDAHESLGERMTRRW